MAGRAAEVIIWQHINHTIYLTYNETKSLRVKLNIYRKNVPSCDPYCLETWRWYAVKALTMVFTKTEDKTPNVCQLKWISVTYYIVLTGLCYKTYSYVKEIQVIAVDSPYICVPVLWHDTKNYHLEISNTPLYDEKLVTGGRKTSSFSTGSR